MAPASMRRYHEFEQCRALWQWVRLATPRIPELELLIHVPLGELRDARAGARLKAMGARAGVPDYLLLLSRGRWAGLALEVKSPHGRQTKTQREWFNRLTRAGWCCRIVTSWLEARDVLEAYCKCDDAEGGPH